MTTTLVGKHTAQKHQISHPQLIHVPRAIIAYDDNMSMVFHLLLNYISANTTQRTYIISLLLSSIKIILFFISLSVVCDNWTDANNVIYALIYLDVNESISNFVVSQNNQVQHEWTSRRKEGEDVDWSRRRGQPKNEKIKMNVAEVIIIYGRYMMNGGWTEYIQVHFNVSRPICTTKLQIIRFNE